ncbi:uncharacterized protein LOC101861941 [Aplysia californica]|uniref:Uncharacterized protein LOC101861941 n=1 Tax=Aplysia californica TaxID=6500 RepID=A0ABM0JHI2_APLCA|nr:uncharacterized protein LOC101861941 [Aplysia californica]XP_005093778.1 uncharacterized protein LOC101861941 [Aplysia californica]XP_035824475.1 uncharacterized protein LOC101861941 [Aplysia californica]XP_035824476.1 uncharacterized protein LOC101861941 [Aplysia californica]
MGCVSSKAVVTSSHSDLTSVTSKDNGKPARGSRTDKSDLPGPSSSSQTFANGTERFAVFGEKYDDVPGEAVHGEGVQNAKPKLPRSGIGRGTASYNDPITPGIEGRAIDDLDLSRIDNGSFLNLSGYSLSSLSDIDQDENKVSKKSTHQSHWDRTEKNSSETVTMIPEFKNSPFVEDGKEDEVSILNLSKNNLNLSRASSAKAGSVLTTTALNTSFATTHDDDIYSELALSTPLTDFDEPSSYRTASITPLMSQSEDPTPATLLSKQFGPIMEEYEGGFTPRSITNGECAQTPRSVTNGDCAQTPRSVTNGDCIPTPQSGTNEERVSTPSLTFLPREVLEHNRNAGWNEWSMYKGKVYDNISLRNVFKPLIYLSREEMKRRVAEKREEREERRKLQKQEEDEESDGEDDDVSVYSEELIPKYDLEREETWDRNGVKFILLNRLEKSVVQAHLPQCCVGSLERTGTARYWADIREDVKSVLNDLIGKDACVDYMHLLQRWIKKYRDSCPSKNQLEQGDPNSLSFPLPEEIAEDPDSLRKWLELWEPFEMDIPEEGAWDMAEVDEFDLSNSHEIFLASLRSHFEPIPFDMDIDGEAGWEVICENLIAEDRMTESQRRVAELRSFRTDLHDPKRMERRRHKILSYFVKKYEMDQSKVNHFLTWADEMEKGEKRFLELCN